MICRHNGALPQNVTSLENRFNPLPIFSPEADMSEKLISQNYGITAVEAMANGLP